MTPPDPEARRKRNRNRVTLVVIAVLFIGSAAVAGLLRFSGWKPAGMKNNGELLQPPADLRALSPRLEAGGTYAWSPADRTWRILVVAGDDCGAPCVALSRDLDKAWRLFGRDAGRVHTLWVGSPPAGVVRNESWHVVQPDPALQSALAALPGADATGAGAPVYVVDPNGFVILHYAPGFPPGHLRQDLARLLKLK